MRISGVRKAPGQDFHELASSRNGEGRKGRRGGDEGNSAVSFVLLVKIRLRGIWLGKDYLCLLFLKKAMLAVAADGAGGCKGVL